MGVYPTAFAINMLYPQVEKWPTASYWFDAGTEHLNWDEFSSGQPVTFEKYTETFTATKQDVVAITFNPGQDQCLWILRPAYADIRGLSAQAQKLADGLEPVTSSTCPRINTAPRNFWTRAHAHLVFFIMKGRPGESVPGMGEDHSTGEGCQPKGFTRREQYRAYAVH